MNIQIVTDSTCDLAPEIVNKHKITIIPLHINVGENDFLDGVNLSRDEFYTQLPTYHPFPKTAAPSVTVFQQLYAKLADEGAKAIISIHISESLSATVNSARIAAREFTRIPVTVIDSTQLSLGMGFLVEKAAELAQAGKGVNEIVSILNKAMPRTYVFAALKTLEYLHRSGRMNYAIAKFGEILQIKPLLHMNMGKATAHRTRTQNRSTAQLFTWLTENSPYEKLAVLHAGVEQEAYALSQQAKSFFPENREVPIVQITPVLGAHLGVGALGFACISSKE